MAKSKETRAGALSFKIRKSFKYKGRIRTINLKSKNPKSKGQVDWLFLTLKNRVGELLESCVRVRVFMAGVRLYTQIATTQIATDRPKQPKKDKNRKAEKQKTLKITQFVCYRLYLT